MTCFFLNRLGREKCFNIKIVTSVVQICFHTLMQLAHVALISSQLNTCLLTTHIIPRIDNHKGLLIDKKSEFLQEVFSVVTTI